MLHHRETDHLWKLHIDILADQNVSCNLFVKRFQSSCDVDGVADHGVFHPALIAKVAHNNWNAMDANPCGDRHDTSALPKPCQALLLPALVKVVQRFLHGYNAAYSCNGVICGIHGSAKNGKDAIAEKFNSCCMILIDDVVHGPPRAMEWETWAGGAPACGTGAAQRFWQVHGLL